MAILWMAELMKRVTKCLACLADNMRTIAMRKTVVLLHGVADTGASGALKHARLAHPGRGLTPYLSSTPAVLH
jgi:hypothetical protein